MQFSLTLIPHDRATIGKVILKIIGGNCNSSVYCKRYKYYLSNQWEERMLRIVPAIAIAYKIVIFLLTRNAIAIAKIYGTGHCNTVRYKHYKHIYTYY